MRLTKLAIATFFASGALLVTGSAHAAQLNNSFNVKLRIVESCTIDRTIDDIDFGLVNSNTTGNLDQQTALEISCNNQSGYTVALKPSNNNTAGAGVMDARGNGHNDTVAYSLYQDPSRTLAWGSVSGTNTLSETGNKSIPVYARVTQADYAGKQAGNYNDVVSVVVTY
ncbi:spore coat U domain-containing protein [Serratia microhaemolytica]|uniref:Csu type fimbrial protein n=1 Tax=Serratia microhaemolytica TaxID=2675110 RepID=UPI000FDF0833|nr:spore coat U domain-containing protein [Serratia microhaemolytica]